MGVSPFGGSAAAPLTSTLLFESSKLELESALDRLGINSVALLNIPQVPVRTEKLNGMLNI